jgi:diaminopimelate epimerase
VKMKLQFSKYQGTGNDFIIIDDRTNALQLPAEKVNKLCNRHFGIGADGLMLLRSNPAYDFEMIYYNADGNESSMCGNGGRCLVRFAYDNGIKKSNFKFIAVDGEHEAELAEHNWVHLKMKNVTDIHEDHGDFVLDTGSPHYVKPVTDALATNVVEEGKAIRYSKEFEAEGINVNFVEATDSDKIIVRTYERGVEDETLSCGTGVTASAIVFAHNDIGFNRIEVKTLGGKLAVEFDKINDNHFKNIWLCGPAHLVFKGEVEI